MFSHALGLFQALYPGVTPGGAQETRWGAGGGTQVGCYQTNTLPTVLFSWPLASNVGDFCLSKK